MPANKSLYDALSTIKTDKSKVLGLTFGTQEITPGQQFPKADAPSPPKLAFSTTSSGTYIVICIDLDVPYQWFNFLGPILHWMQPGLKSGGAGSQALTVSDTPVIAHYLPPTPPPFSGPHRYVFLLYEQPADFDVKKYAPPAGEDFVPRNRMWYNLTTFEKEAKLGPVVAANYFCSN